MLYTARGFKGENLIPVGCFFYVAVFNLSANWFCLYNLFQPNVIGNYIDPWWYKSPPPQPGQRSRSDRAEHSELAKNPTINVCKWPFENFPFHYVNNMLCILAPRCLDIWPRPGDPLRNVVMWMDHRAEDQASRITNSNHGVLSRVGGVMSPEMQPPKLLWLKEVRGERGQPRTSNSPDLCLICSRVSMH